MTGLSVVPSATSDSVSTADENEVKAILAAEAAKYDLHRVQTAGGIVAYRGGRVGLFTPGIAFVQLWRVDDSGHPLWRADKPNQLHIDIGSPTPGGATFLGKRIFREVKAQLRERFGSRVRDTSVTIVNPI